MQKIKTVQKNGKITVTKAEDRYPYAADALMSHGFTILFLNMALGLLPVTIWGSRLKYFKCSISQLYTTLFFLCFVALSCIFTPVYYIAKEEEGQTQATIIVAMGIAQILAYAILLIRGVFVAKQMPVVWSQLCKLVQISIIDVYGTKCHLFKDISKYTIWATGEFAWAMGLTLVLGGLLTSEDFSSGLSRSYMTYDIALVIPSENRTGFQEFLWFTYQAGYFIWHMCNSSHMLVSMLLCLIVIIITACLKSVNTQIQEFMDFIDDTRSHGLSLFASKIKFQMASGNSPVSSLSSLEEGRIIKRIENINKAILITEEVTGAMSTVFGISIIVEAVMFIATGTENVFKMMRHFQASMDKKFDDGQYINSMELISIFNMATADVLLNNLIGTASIHFYFLFKLSYKVNDMLSEAKMPLHLLKYSSYSNLPPKIQNKIQTLKQDLASASISLTAGNYFQINKFLITSIVSQVTTYVIVLLQFYQQENARGHCNSTSN